MCGQCGSGGRSGGRRSQGAGSWVRLARSCRGGMRWRDEGVWWAVGAAAGKDSRGEDSGAEEERESVRSEGG